MGEREGREGKGREVGQSWQTPSTLLPSFPPFARAVIAAGQKMTTQSALGTTYDVCKISDFFTPLVCLLTQPLLLSLLTASAFGVPPSLCRHHMYMAPNVRTTCSKLKTPAATALKPFNIRVAKSCRSFGSHRKVNLNLNCAISSQI